MPLLYFLLQKSLRAYFASLANNGRFALKQATFLLGAFLNALLISIILNTLGEKSGVEIIAYFQGMIFFLMLIKNIFPQYNPFREFFSKALPLSAWERSSYTLALQFLRAPQFFVLLFCVFMMIFSEQYALSDFLLSMLIIPAGFLAERNLLLAFTLRPQERLKGLLATLALLGAMCWLLFFAEAAYRYVLLLPVCAAVLLAHWQMQAPPQPQKNAVEKRSTYSLAKLVGNAFYRRKIVYKSLVVAVVFKTLIGILITITIFKKGEDSLKEELLMFALICTPTIFFTYIFNNFFAMIPQGFQLLGYYGTYQTWWRVYLRLLLPWLLPDFLISAVLLIASGLGHWMLVVLVLSQIHLLSSLYGFLFSLHFAKKAPSDINLSELNATTTSLGAGLLTGVIVIGLLVSASMQAWVVFVPLSLLAWGIGLYQFWLAKRHKERLFREILRVVGA